MIHHACGTPHRTDRRTLLAVGCAGLMACSGARDASPPAADSGSSAMTETVPADSLVLTTPLGDVWLTDAREARDSAGATCVERVIEIRRDSAFKVPLLYTGAAPVLVDDSTLRADLWLKCRPVARYTVDLRTGRPTPDGR